MNVLAAARGGGQRPAIDVGDEDVLVPAAVGGVGDRLTLCTPRGEDVEEATDRHPLDVFPVVIGDIQLLDRAVVDGSHDPLLVPVGREREPGSCDTPKTALMSVDLVRKLVCVEAGIAR